MHTIEKYLLWKNQPNLDAALREELERLSKDEIEEAFYTDLAFGTGGLRGLMGVGTNRINVYIIRKATLGFARYLKKTGNNGGVAISYDNRKDSRLFAFEAAKVLAAQGMDAYVFDQMRPTPMLSFAVRHFQCAGGIMITASHNPKAYNGYKAYDSTGAQLNILDAEAVINEIHAIDNPFVIPSEDNHHIKTIGKEIDALYLRMVEEIAIHKEEKKVRIVYSPLHGTGGTVIPALLRNASYDVLCYGPQMKEDPNFSETASSNPEEAVAYDRTIAHAKAYHADLVMVTDPDADRLGIAVLHEGTYHLLTGNQTAAIELYYLLSEKKRLGLLPKKGFVYTTIVTTDIIKVIAESFKMDVVTTLTGFKFIGEQAEKNQKIAPYLFGCEESYGSLIKDFVRDKDAVQAVYLLAEIANHMKLQGKTLIDYLESIYQTFGYYHEYTKNITLPGLSGLARIDQIMTHYRNHPPLITGKSLIRFDDLLHGTRIEGKNTSKIDLPSSNVLKYQYEGNTWITFRPSGTEPKIKIYFGTKASSMDKAIDEVRNLSDMISKDIDRI